MCDWEGMEWNVIKGWDLKGEKDDVIVLVPRLLFQQDCMACQLERDWKLNFMLLCSTSLLTSCMV